MNAKNLFRLVAVLAFASSIALSAQSEQNSETQETATAEVEDGTESLDSAVDALTEVETELFLEQVKNLWSDLAELAAPLAEEVGPFIDSVAETIKEMAEGVEMVRTNSAGMVLSATPEGQLTVVGVVSDSPAHQAGIRPQDVIVSIDGVVIEQSDDPRESARRLISSAKPGDTVRIRVSRDNSQQDVSVTVNGYVVPSIVVNPNASPSLSYAVRQRQLRDAALMERIQRQSSLSQEAQSRWMTRLFRTDVSLSERVLSVIEVEEELGHYFGVDFGVLVIEVPEDHEKLKPGDILMRVEDEAVRSYSHAQRYFEEANHETPTKVTVRRKGKRQTVELDKGEWLLIQAHEYR